MPDFPMIEILDFNGESALRYLRLGDDRYYGGTTCDEYRKRFPFAYGPHVWLPTIGMLDLIANIANLPGDPRAFYSLQGAGSGRYNYAAILREMNADTIADILGCDAQAVRDRFHQLVLIPYPEQKPEVIRGDD